VAVPVVYVSRNGAAESVHYGNLAIVNADGKLLYKVGDPYAVTFMRSSAKPWQAIDIVESGAYRKFGFTPTQLAIMCASHSGEEMHTKVVAEILTKIGIEPEQLHCGIHIPMYYTHRGLTPPPELKITTLHHNCSGKHAAMLALCKFHNYPIDNYLDINHPVQQTILDNIAGLCKYPKEKILIGVDGCSSPVYGMPLYNMAWGFARFVTPNSVPAEKAKVYSVIYRAMIENPDMVGGTGRYDTALMSSCRGKIVAKIGAEGVHCAGILDKGMAMAAKIIDGARRAIFPFSLEALHQLGEIDDCQVDALKEFRASIILNHRNIEVGDLKADFKLEAVEG
jgi:L-asparaginase II